MSTAIYDLDALIRPAIEEDWTGMRELYHDRSQRRENKRGTRANHKGGHRSTLLDLPICALDGEGETVPNGRHDYFLMIAVWPGGRRRSDPAKHLSTEACLDFVMNLPDDHVYLIYGGSYDMNMWLRDLPNGTVDKLLDRPKWRYRQFEIEWVERKYMTIRAYGKTRTVYDVLAFFQVPFVARDPTIGKGACEAWLPECSADFEFVRLMKDLRGNFANVARDAIERYTYLECELLEKLMRKFIDALKACEVRPRALYGPGAVAAAYLEKKGVKRYMTALPAALGDLDRRAYFGGRFDAAVFGWIENVWQIVFKSAYPSVARHLPCLKCGAWEYVGHCRDYARIAEHGLYHVRWHVPEASRWGPFPHRTEQGLIYYPYEGAGWYHADEVKAAIEFYGEDAINVLEGWSLTSTCDHHPFAFIDSLYALRKAQETAGNYDQGVVIKLILNSLYGKLAQQVGMRKDRPPPFQCFFWAGEITAGTRAMILRAIAMSPEKVISIATDGIVVTEELDLEYGEELGEWDIKKLSGFAQLSNGVYHATDMAKNKPIDRARGLGRGVLDYDKKSAMYRAWRDSKGMGSFTYKGRTRFITHREARNHSNRDDVKCRWIDDKYRTMKFCPERRLPWPDKAARKRDLLGTRLMSYRDYPTPDHHADEESQPFRVKTKSQEVHDARALNHPRTWYDAA